MITELLSAAGFLIAFYIFLTVHRHGQLACPLGKNCNAVVESKYWKLLGIRNDALGMFYYAVVFLVALYSIPVPHSIALLVTGAGAAMATTLLSIQAFVLHKWCDFCVGSSLVAIALFVVQALA